MRLLVIKPDNFAPTQASKSGRQRQRSRLSSNWIQDLLQITRLLIDFSQPAFTREEVVVRNQMTGWPLRPGTFRYPLENLLRTIDEWDQPIRKANNL